MTAPGSSGPEAARLGPDTTQLADLRGEGWQRLLTAARRKLERTGGTPTGSVGLTDPTEAERRAVIGTTGRYRPEGVKRLTVDLADLDRALRTAYGSGLMAILTELHGPLRDRRGERDTESGHREQLGATLTESRHHSEPWYTEWSEALLADGTLTRLIRRGEGHIIAWAVGVLDRLPVPDGLPPLPLPVLAEKVTGDTKALVAGTPLTSLTLRALALWAGTQPPQDANAKRLLWERFGAVADDLASQVLVLNLRSEPGPLVADWLCGAADHGVPFRLTLHQLSLAPLHPTAVDLYVCENPAVLRAAAAELGPDSAALICTEGVPSAACRRLLEAAVQAGARLRARADFDWSGLRIAGSLLTTENALPWRMAREDYRKALTEGDSTPLLGPAATSPWDPDLSTLMAETGHAVMEERLLPALLTDLAASSRRK